MTDAEMKTVARIVMTADNWCSTCQRALLVQLRHAFPDHVKTINAVENDETLRERYATALNDWYDHQDDDNKPEVWKV